MTLAAGDLITLHHYQNSGATQTLYNADRGIRLAVDEVPNW